MVLINSKFMFNSKATANGDRYVREYLNVSGSGFQTASNRKRSYTEHCSHIIEQAVPPCYSILLSCAIRAI